MWKWQIENEAQGSSSQMSYHSSSSADDILLSPEIQLYNQENWTAQQMGDSR